MLLNPESSPLFPFGPSVSALIVTAVVSGRKALQALLTTALRWRVAWSNYAIALLLPVGLTVAAVYTNVLLGAPAPSAGDLDGWYLLPIVMPLLLIVGGPLGEELGWRGFLLPRLQSRAGVIASTLLVGILWAAWHLPEFVSDPEGQRPPLQFVVWVMAMSIVFTWLFVRTQGSVLLAMLLHASTNTILGFFLRMYIDGPDYDRLWWLNATGWCGAALVLLVWRRFSTGADGARASRAAEDRAVDRVAAVAVLDRARSTIPD